MRTIEISNEIFGKIWSASVEGDESENDILARMFAEREFLAEVEAEPEHVETKTIQVKSHERTITIPRIGKITWIDDVALALDHIGGKGQLAEIYKSVRAIRSRGGRSLPPSTEAVIRKTLEENSSDSDAYKGGMDLFALPEGKGRGMWALRYAN